MIPIYVPSKDRACQAHCLLESLEKNAPGLFSPHVVYTYSNDDFKQGYDRVIKEFPAVAFYHEENGKLDFYYFLLKNKYSPVGLFSDDCIFYKPSDVNEEEINGILSQEDIWCLSLRLGLNITVVDYTINKPCPYPPFYEICNDKFMRWSYRNSYDKFECYFMFPTAFDGCFYQTKDLLWLSDNGHFDRILLFEHMICNNGRQQMTSKDKMVCPIQSNVMVQQINSSHEYGHRTNRTFNRSLEQLNIAYLAGKSIDLDSMDFSKVNCCHGEIAFNMKENNARII